MRPSTDPLSNRRAAASGLTLVELLVSILIGGFVSAGLTAMLNAEFRSSSAILRYQRSARHAAHARRFIESEAATATRLEQGDANTLKLFGVHPGTTTPYTITYAVENAPSGFRGPQVLMRNGPPYTDKGILNKDIGNQNFVILDGLDGDSALAANGNTTESSLGAALSLTVAGGDANYTPNFFITVATSPALGVLQLPASPSFSGGCNPTATGCRQGGSGTIQEWDTRLLSGTTSPITITPSAASNPSEVIIYFNANRPTGTNPSPIRRASSTSSGTCIRTSCYVDFPSGTDYFINAVNSRVDRLVFRDGVVGVPAN